MISCVLSGGLGNQLFQLFTVFAYHIQHNTHYVFSRTKTTKNDPRPLYWTTFLSTLPADTLVDATAFADWNAYTDPKHTYTPLPTFTTPTLLTGAFQCPRYFDPHLQQIKTALHLPTLQHTIQNTYLTLHSPEYTTISMHFRMGDYKRLRCYHPVLPWQYYVQALHHIVERLGHTNHILVYYFFERGDIALVNEYLSHIQSAHPQFIYVPVTHVPTDWEEMLAMGCCDHHIIANSTFSWWGAYLHYSSTTPIVCYPNVWYGHQLYYIDTRDLCPDAWTRVNVPVNVPCNCFTK